MLKSQIFTKRLLPALWVASFTAMASLSQAQTTIYVNRFGNDRNDGSTERVNRAQKTGPKRTLEGARNQIRLMKRNGTLDPKGAIVLVGAGTYLLNRGFELTPEDSGAPGAPIIYRAQNPDGTIIEGGRRITTWRALSATMRARFKPEVVNNIRVISYRTLRGLSQRGHSVPTTEVWNELIFKDQRMNLSRYPNTGWLQVGKLDVSDPQAFLSTSTTPEGWAAENDIWSHGFFGNNWSDFLVKANYTRGQRRVKLDNMPTYGVREGQRFSFVNVVEEVDSPGEYAVDVRRKLIYFYPPDNDRRNVAVTYLNEALVRFNDASHIRFEGFTLQNGRRNGLEINRGTEITVDGLTIRNMGTDGVLFREGRNNTLSNSNIFGTGEVGVRLNGGDRINLVNANNRVINNHIKEVGQVVHTYRPGILLNGCGNVIANNRLEEMPHIAILVNGNNHLIEKNEVSRVCLETGDAAAIGLGQDMSQQGNIIRFNYVQDVRASQIGSKGLFNECVAFYLDDLTSGTTVYGNVVKRVDQGVHIGGGRDNRVENNVFIDTEYSIHVDARARRVSDAFWNTIQQRLQAVNYTQPPYSTAYPNLARLMNDDPREPKRNLFLRNVTVRGQEFHLIDSISPNSSFNNPNVLLGVTGNYAGNSPGFVNMDGDDYRLSSGSPLQNLGFQPINIREIGLQVTPSRPSVPALAGTNRAVTF